MNHNFTLSVLVHKGVLTLEEAEHLAKELGSRIHSQTFSDAHRICEEIFEKLEKKNKKILDF